MFFEDKTQNNIMIDMIASVDSDINTEEGTLINHSFRGAAAEFENAYISLGVVDQNGYAETADREHLILRAKERGMYPYNATNAEWKAVFNIEIASNSRFRAGELSYLCIGKIEDLTYRLMCEQSGTKGNKNQGELTPVEFISGFDSGKLIELLKPARDDEETESFRKRYLSTVAEAQAFGGNRAQYKQVMHEIDGVGACKIYRVTKEDRRIKIYFLDSRYQVPGDSLVAEVQEIMDPVESQGEGDGKADIFHIVDIFPCISEIINVEAEITVENGYIWGEMLPSIQARIEDYYLELAKEWENEEYIIVRVLKINAAIASVEGIVDVQNTTLNGKAENIILSSNAIPVGGAIVCRH